MSQIQFIMRIIGKMFKLLWVDSLETFAKNINKTKKKDY